MKQGVQFEPNDRGDINVTVTTIQGNVVISNMCIMDQLDFCRQAMPILSQFHPSFKDGVTDVLPSPDDIDG